MACKFITIERSDSNYVRPQPLPIIYPSQQIPILIVIIEKNINQYVKYFFGEWPISPLSKDGYPHCPTACDYDHQLFVAMGVRAKAIINDFDIVNIADLEI